MIRQQGKLSSNLYLGLTTTTTTTTPSAGMEHNLENDAARQRDSGYDSIADDD